MPVPVGSTRVARAEARTLTAPLARPFGIASGGLGSMVENVAVRVELSCGSSGWGEVAALPGVTALAPGAPTLAASRRAARWLESRVAPPAPVFPGTDAPSGGTPWGLARELAEAFPGSAFAPVRAGIEAALLDACARRAGLPLWRLLRRECSLAGVQRLLPEEAGPAPLVTDITIALCRPAEAREQTQEYLARGFRSFKVKVGGPEGWEAGAERVEAVAGAAGPGARLLVDGNEGLSEADARALLKRLALSGSLPDVLEQPCAAENRGAAVRLRRLCDGLAPLRGVEEGSVSGGIGERGGGVALVADEACQGPGDAARIAEGGEAHGVNLKLAKDGLLGALETAAVARAAGLGLMVGGMVETRLGMGVAAHLAAALGGFSEVDLDTPLLLKGADPISGGYSYSGERLDLGESLGHGMALR